ncbi:MAG: hypothetical protein EBX52_06990 [Proteobacteria bacterium]|nr:hypothetical protein [Pseudomonadota bacterium]
MAEQPQGRYRFQAGRPLDPDAGVHPEMMDQAGAPTVEAGIPNSPQELIAMQNNDDKKPQKSDRQPNPKVQQVLELLDRLDTTAGEDQQVALAIVRHLEEYHDSVVKEMQDDTNAKHEQIVRWAVDADRLYRLRMLLESVDLV